MSEEWRPIPGFPGYEVSDLGRVRSPNQLRKNVVGAGGYEQLNLSVHGISSTQKVHVLVARAFHGPRPDGAVIRHLNGDQRDNRAVNLAYGSPGDNLRDQVLHGTHNEARKTHCPQGHEYTPENTRLMRQRHGGPGRICRTCHRERARARYHAQKGGSRNG